MSEHTRTRTPDLTPPLTAWLRRWPVAVALALVGLLIGYGISLLQTVSYTAETRIAVGSGDLSTGAIAGFPLAASQLASNYARYVGDQALVNEDRASIVSSPIPESNVIRIEGTAASRNDALQAVSDAADTLVSTVNESQQDEDLINTYRDTAQRWAESQVAQGAAQSDVDRLVGDPAANSTRLSAARDQLARLTAATTTVKLRLDTLAARYQEGQSASTQADLVPVLDPQVVSSSRSGLTQRWMLLGLVGGVVLSLVVAVLLQRRDDKRRAT